MTVKITAPQCGNCIYYDAEEGTDAGHCRRYPRTVLDSGPARLPIVHSTMDFCGEFYDVGKGRDFRRHVDAEINAREAERHRQRRLLGPGVDKSNPVP